MHVDLVVVGRNAVELRAAVRAHLAALDPAAEWVTTAFDVESGGEPGAVPSEWRADVRCWDGQDLMPELD